MEEAETEAEKAVWRTGVSLPGAAVKVPPPLVPPLKRYEALLNRRQMLTIPRTERTL